MDCLQHIQFGPIRRLQTLFGSSRQETVPHAVQQDVVDRSDAQCKRVGQQRDFAVERCTEQRRIVGADSEDRAGRVQARKGVLGQARVYAETNVARRTDVKGDLTCRQFGKQRVVLMARTP